MNERDGKRVEVSFSAVVRTEGKELRGRFDMLEGGRHSELAEQRDGQGART